MIQLAESYFCVENGARTLSYCVRCFFGGTLQAYRRVLQGFWIQSHERT